MLSGIWGVGVRVSSALADFQGVDAMLEQFPACLAQFLGALEGADVDTVPGFAAVDRNSFDARREVQQQDFGAAPVGIG